MAHKIRKSSRLPTGWPALPTIGGMVWAEFTPRGIACNLYLYQTWCGDSVLLCWPFLRANERSILWIYTGKKETHQGVPVLATVDNGDSEKLVSDAVHWGIQCALLTDERDTCLWGSCIVCFVAMDGKDWMDGKLGKRGKICWEESMHSAAFIRESAYRRQSNLRFMSAAVLCRPRSFEFGRDGVKFEAFLKQYVPGPCIPRIFLELELLVAHRSSGLSLLHIQSWNLFASDPFCLASTGRADFLIYGQSSITKLHWCDYQWRNWDRSSPAPFAVIAVIPAPCDSTRFCFRASSCVYDALGRENGLKSQLRLICAVEWSKLFWLEKVWAVQLKSQKWF